MPSGRSSIVKLSDKMLYALLALGAAGLAVLGFCPLDWLWAVATLLVIGPCAWILRSRCARQDEDEARSRR